MSKYSNKIAHLYSRLLATIRPDFKIIIDKERKLGNFELAKVGYRTDIVKEDLSRHYVFTHSGENLNFLDVGARDGELSYLLGMQKNLIFDRIFYNKNMAAFKAKYKYYGMDLLPASDERVLSGDACDPCYVERNPSFREKFDVIYSNNVFEHFNRPWIAIANLHQLLKPGGIVITIVPFSTRYHESPGDYFRYTHKGLESLFLSVGQYEIIESGYDICGRRNNWQGSGDTNDIVPLDNFGAWRETWFTVCVVRKLQDHSVALN